MRRSVHRASLSRDDFLDQVRSDDIGIDGDEAVGELLGIAREP